jgi:hypothetical protein
VTRQATRQQRRTFWDVLQSRLSLVATLVSILGSGGLLGVLHLTGVIGGGPATSSATRYPPTSVGLTPSVALSSPTPLNVPLNVVVNPVPAVPANPAVPAAPTGLVAPPAANAPLTPAPTLNLSRSSGPPGTVLTVSGTGFAPRETVNVTFSTRRIGQVTADARGAFSGLPVTIPADWAFKGQVSITAQGTTSIRWVDEPFQVQ